MSKKFTDLAALTTPATNDILPIDDVSASTTKKITIADLMTLATSKSVDANGWTVYQQSSWTEYRKQVAYGTYTKAAGEVWTIVSAAAFPVGMSTLGTNHISYTAVQGSGNGFSLGFNAEMVSASTNINLTAINNGAASYSFAGYIDILIVTP